VVAARRPGLGETPSGMRVRRSPLLAALAVAVAATLTIAIVVALGGAGGTAPEGRQEAAALPSASVSGTATASASATRSTVSSPAVTSPAPTSPPPTPPPAELPALVGAIGDSLTVAVNAEPRFGDQPQHSWVLGDDPEDGVESHLERLQALGAEPASVMAARPGAAIATAVGQAQRVVAAAPGEGIAYVTFELGANDICAPSLEAATDPAAFAAAVEEAFALLADGLPAGSRLLVLSVPDVTRLRSVLEDIPKATSLHRQYGVCTSVLGETVALDGIRDRIAAYNTALVAACEARAGSALDCRHDLAGPPSGSLFGAEFTLDDLSSLDYFHPSLHGQARIAQAAWQLTPWAGAGDVP
jgi:lysophospholipase L1-like esterase